MILRCKQKHEHEDKGSISMPGTSFELQLLTRELNWPVKADMTNAYQGRPGPRGKIVDFMRQGQGQQDSRASRRLALTLVGKDIKWTSSRGWTLWRVKQVRHGTWVSPLYQDVKNRDVESYGVEHQNNVEP